MELISHLFIPSIGSLLLYRKMLAPEGLDEEMRQGHSMTWFRFGGVCEMFHEKHGAMAHSICQTSVK
ncbi:hypothetical protein ASF69_21815 [Rhizobium sp. Leaf311]|nr:hypothetical protein ASF69_21815 [Rhizobium sp. Leaf311]